jgi:hypothetical protein
MRLMHSLFVMAVSNNWVYQCMKLQPGSITEVDHTCQMNMYQ